MWYNEVTIREMTCCGFIFLQGGVVMSDRYGFDFDNDGKVSFTESHMTYHIERETAQNNSLYDSLKRSPKISAAQSNNKSNSDSSRGGNGIIYLILLLSALGWIIFFIKMAIGR